MLPGHFKEAMMQKLNQNYRFISSQTIHADCLSVGAATNINYEGISSAPVIFITAFMRSDSH
jgi:hypothetical protein